MGEQGFDSFTIAPDKGGRRNLPDLSSWAVLATVALGGLNIAFALAGLLGSGTLSGSGFVGINLVRLALGAGLVMRNELARLVYLAFSIFALYLMALDGITHNALAAALQLLTMVLLTRPSVRRAFD